MPEVSKERLSAYRAHTFSLEPGKRLKNVEDAVHFVEERGYVFFWPIKGVVFPSLWTATAGDRPVADAHDDPGHVTWGWKDSLLGSRRWYYAKILRKKSTMIASDLVPFFYALSENYGAYEEDYLTIYEQGRMTMEARQVYEALLDHGGPLDTVELRRATRMTSAASDARFNKAVTDLQSDFKILPVGVTQSGAWRYAFAYDIVPRHYPDLPDLAHQIQEKQARLVILEYFALALGAFEQREAQRILGWRPPEIQTAVQGLIARGSVRPCEEVAGRPGDWLAVRALVDAG